MTDKNLIEKPLIQQIFYEMFANIEARDEFDQETVQNLKQLATAGNLHKPAKVIKAIKSTPQATHENP